MMERVNDRLYNWASDVDPGAIRQAEMTARLPIIEDHVALMSDAHVGKGATVGSVIPTAGAIIPSAVGVDIGCGMIARRLDMDASMLPDDLDEFLSTAERVVPAGVGQGHAAATSRSDQWFAANGVAPGASEEQTATARKQFGSLGSGNHFFEVCLDEHDQVWLVLHSGSRGVGNRLATSHIDKAKGMAERLHLSLEDPDLAYFTQSQPEFEAYIADMMWAQNYAMGNRQAMMEDATRAFVDFVWHTMMGAPPPDDPYEVVMETINCHHNFTAPETFNGQSLWITRKGAIRAYEGELGVIPGSMGACTYIVRGLGNELAWNSCSHGAGRRMSRSKAKKQFTAEDLHAQMQGRSWLAGKASALVDEIPSAYKDIDQVMADQTDLVETVATLHQVLNYKGC